MSTDVSSVESGTPTITNAPSGQNNTTSLNISIGGSILAYSYFVASGSVDCTSGSYSGPRAVSDLITDDIGITGLNLSDGPVYVCVIGQRLDGTWQTSTDAVSRSWTKDTLAPQIIGVTSLTNDGVYQSGSAINVNISFSENINFSTGGGSFKLKLATGQADDYALATTDAYDVSSLGLSYTVDADDYSADLNFDPVIAPVLFSGATIKDLAGNSLSLSLLSVGMYLSNSKNIKLVGTPAVLTISDPDVVTPFNFGTRYVDGSFIKYLNISNQAGAVVPAQMGASAFDVTQFGYVSGGYPGVGGDCGATLLPGASCIIAVRFAPNLPQSFTGNLTFTYDNGVNAAANVQRTLTGVGIHAWVATNPSILSGRNGHSIIWTGDRILIWGGSSGSTFYNSGAIFNPTTNTWTSMSTSGAPSGRAFHRAVWTGNKMLIWGGVDIGSQYLVSGAAYDPIANTWSTIGVAGAPSGRKDFSAIWTGSRMIIWGGYVNAVGPVNSGGIYNPDTDSWATVSTTGAPVGRHGHVAVWTGTRMVVWGGMAPSYSNDGGMYDPATETWTSTGTIGAPSVRTQPAAVWTGDKMVVWGGMDSAGKLGDGAALDPLAAAAAQWTPIPTLGAPSPRVNHSMVWTGTRLIVWGGYDGAYLNNGGIFNPLLSTWVPTNDTGVPAARAMNAGVWMNGRMFVWGGTGSGSDLNSGGMFAPLPN